MTGVQQGGAQQCRQADALALAGKVQPMQQDGTFKQRPEGRQNGDENDAADNGRGSKNIRSIAVAQIVHGSVFMEAKKLEILMTAVDLGSFSKASEVVGYTQSGLTHLVNSLEREIGFPLIIRSHNGISLRQG